MGVKEASADYVAAQDAGCPVGYKQTEVGVIPADWVPTKLAECASFRTGPFGSALHQADYIFDGVPIINPMQIVDGALTPTLTMSITEQKAKQLSEFRLTPGSIVIGRRGEMGRCALVRPEQDGWLCGTGSMIIRIKPSCEADYIRVLLSSSSVIAAIENASVGTTMINLNQGTLSSLILPLPPTRAEQEAIAKALSDTDALIESLQQLIAKKRQIKQGAMQGLLTGKRRLPGFSGAWEVKPLGSICSMKSGEGITAGNIDSHSEFPCYGGNGLRGFTGSYTHEGRYALIGRQGALCGNVVGVRGKFFASEHALVVAASPTTDIQWLSIVLERMNLNQYSESSAQPGLSAVKLLVLNIDFPPSTDEQAAIAMVLSDMDAEITALEIKLAKTRQLKQGMMHELLTGRTRLV